MNNSHLPRTQSTKTSPICLGRASRRKMPREDHIVPRAPRATYALKQLIRNVPFLALPVAYLSSPLFLGCPIQGHPTPNITWFHGGQSVATVTGLTHHILAAGQILQVANLNGESQGEFSCLAQNEAGVLVQKASLVIQGKNPWNFGCWAYFLNK